MIDRAEFQIRRDMQYLAGDLPHRGAYTEQEKAAALYLKERFEEYTPDVEVDDFTSIESYYYLFASYYAEFLFVAIVALWLPKVAFAYGLVVFLAYLAEFTTYRLSARLLPQYESQNVVARLMSPHPLRLFIVTANYDSPREGILSAPIIRRHVRGLHFLLVLCMMGVLVSCLLQGYQTGSMGWFRPDLSLRWTAVGCLAIAGALLFYHEVGAEFSVGANDNASGVAVLLALAERLRGSPLLDGAEVWFVATGAREAWMSGMYHFVKTPQFDREHTYFLHLSNVGRGELRYATGEGLLHVFPSSPEMVQAASRVAADYGAEPIRHHGLPSDALVTLARGYKSLHIAAVEPEPAPSVEDDDAAPAADNLARIEYATIRRAVAFAEATLYELSAALVRRSDEAPAASRT